MKKTLIRMAGLLAALAIVVVVSRLWAENKEKKTAPRTRIGLFNLTYVIKNYDKYKQFQEEIKQTVEPFQKRDHKLRAQLDKLRQQAEKVKKDEATIVRTKVEDLEEKAKKVQREMEDNTAKAKLTLGKRSDAEMKILFTDVEEVVKRYAACHDLDLVLHYNDAVTVDDQHNAQNIARRLNTGALLPLYSVEGIDITKELTQLLNERMGTERDEE